jgi:hypothetical protein
MNTYDIPSHASHSLGASLGHSKNKTQLLGSQRSRGLWFEASPSKTFARLHLNQWLGMVAILGSADRRVTVQASPGFDKAYNEVLLEEGKSDFTSWLEKSQKTFLSLQTLALW